MYTFCKCKTGMLSCTFKSQAGEEEGRPMSVTECMMFTGKTGGFTELSLIPSIKRAHKTYTYKQMVRSNRKGCSITL
jgi:hypothetical protein